MCTNTGNNVATLSEAAVFFTDILGFKRLVRSATPNREVYNLLLKFQLLSHKIVRDNPHVHGVAISDSIVLWVDLSVPGAFRQLMNCIDYLLIRSFASPPSVPVRSGIGIGSLSVSRYSIGDSRYNSRVFYGSAYLDAYELASTHGLGIRCLLSPKATSRLSRLYPMRVTPLASYQQYLWPAAAAAAEQAYSKSYADTLLDQVEGMQPLPDATALNNIADSLALLLQYCDDASVGERAVNWVRRNQVCCPSLGAAIERMLSQD